MKEDRGDWSLDPEFMERMGRYYAAGAPIGQEPTKARFPDPAMAASGWTLGYPRIDGMTGAVLAPGELSAIEQARAWWEAIRPGGV